MYSFTIINYSIKALETFSEVLSVRFQNTVSGQGIQNVFDGKCEGSFTLRAKWHELWKAYIINAWSIYKSVEENAFRDQKQARVEAYWSSNVVWEYFIARLDDELQNINIFYWYASNLFAEQYMPIVQRFFDKNLNELPAFDRKQWMYLI